MDIQMNELRTSRANFNQVSSPCRGDIRTPCYTSASVCRPVPSRGARGDGSSTGKVTVWVPEVDEGGAKIDEFDDTPGDFDALPPQPPSIIAQRLQA